MAVLWFGHYQMGFVYSDHLSIFFNGRRKLIGASPLDIRVMTTDVALLSYIQIHVLCLTQLPILKSDFEINQSVMSDT